MFTRLCQATSPVVLLLCASCSSTPETSSQTGVDPAVERTENVSQGTEVAAQGADESAAAAPAREVPDFFALKPWTGAFQETAVMVADTVRIEGPEGLLDHVAAASDDNFYERTAEVTAAGFRQTIVRLGPDAPEIRVRIDRWTVAATKRVVILENINACEVTVVAAGEALWRDVNGHVAQADRLEFIGEIGQNAPIRPANIQDVNADLDSAPPSVPAGQGNTENAAETSSPNESSPTPSVPQGIENAPTDEPGAESGAESFPAELPAPVGSPQNSTLDSTMGKELSSTGS